MRFLASPVDTRYGGRSSSIPEQSRKRSIYAAFIPIAKTADEPPTLFSCKRTSPDGCETSAGPQQRIIYIVHVRQCLYCQGLAAIYRGLHSSRCTATTLSQLPRSRPTSRNVPTVS